jgi:hypothetical protein
MIIWPSAFTFSIPFALGVLSLIGFSVKVDGRSNFILANRREMTTKSRLLLSVVALVFAVGSSAVGQTPPFDPGNSSPQAPSSPAPSAKITPKALAEENAESSRPGIPTQPLFDFKDSDIKFSLESLMKTLRDGRHEGWVLAAYPDPKTKRPLIGAGFSLDVQYTEHLQRDPRNPHPFLEPSSAQLWQDAGLAPERLQRILNQYDRDLKTWTTKTYRRKIRAKTLTPEVTDDEAMRLLRISAIQAIYNAKAYCRSFDQLTALQQMALSQLVFQMGVNLEEFTQFLATLNAESSGPESPSPDRPVESSSVDHWKTVQYALIDSQWARLYTNRASTVVAMFDPNYSEDPSGAQRRVDASLRPIVLHRRKGGPGGSLRTATYNKGVARTRRRGSSRSRSRRQDR